VLLGDVDLTWRDESRLHSIELRTARTQWQPSTLPIPMDHADESSMTLGLEFDVNRIASIDVDVSVLWDAAQARLGLRFGNAEPENGRWLAIADNAFVSVDDEQALIEIRFADVQIASADAS
jgi:hypothetical protein